MGYILHRLHRKNVPPACDLEASRLITEDNKGESFHLHYRNIRLEFDEPAFRQFCDHVMRSYHAHLAGTGTCLDDGRTGPAHRYVVLDKVVIPAEAEITPTKFQIEVNWPFIVHVHLRNLRLEFTYREVRRMMRGLRFAGLRLRWYYCRQWLRRRFASQTGAARPPAVPAPR
jgi:hypothetical protein